MSSKKRKVVTSSDESDSGPDDRNDSSSKKQKATEKKNKKAKDDDQEGMFPLGKMRYVRVSEFKGRVLVDIREFYDDNGTIKPGRKGIALNVQQFNALKESMDEISEAVKELA